MPRFYRNADGEYLGAYDGAQPPEAAIEVPRAPATARDIWDGSQWVRRIPTTEELRAEAEEEAEKTLAREKALAWGIVDLVMANRDGLLDGRNLQFVRQRLRDRVLFYFEQERGL